MREHCGDGTVPYFDYRGNKIEIHEIKLHRTTHTQTNTQHTNEYTHKAGEICISSMH